MLDHVHMLFRIPPKYWVLALLFEKCLALWAHFKPYIFDYATSFVFT